VQRESVSKDFKSLICPWPAHGCTDAPKQARQRRARLARYSEAETLHLLDELVDLGLLEAVEASEHHDLDFTGNFNAADLRKTAR
jgi:hypothetical protein